ncbi:MAG: hypothetical protein Q9177_006350 [Variospora cf. flavescens]
MPRLRNTLSSCTSRILISGVGRFLLCFTFLYLLLLQICRYTFYRDPTSAFFDPSKAYRHIYSEQRQRQADAYLQAANVSTTNDVQLSGPEVTLCLGLATVQRPGEQYVRSAYASLMEGLTKDDREHIYSVLLIGHADPERHPIYHEPWLRHLSDKLLTYNTSDTKQMELLRSWEQTQDYRKKAIFDYTYLLETCIETGAPGIAIVEDDIIAVAGWYPRTIAALDIVKSKGSEWLYLRLFYTEQFLGWNSEFWPTYLFASVSIVLAVAAMLLILRHLHFHTSISAWLILTACFVCTPACIALFFIAGRMSMLPLTPGVHEMPNFGCCAQGFVFSSTTAGRVVGKLKEKEVGFVDMILEEWANEEKLTRFAIVPSLLQHIGGRSSKGDDFKPTEFMSTADTIFNFGFELYRQDGARITHPVDA